MDGNYDTPGLLADAAKKSIPEVEDAMMMAEDNSEDALQAGQKILKVGGTAAGNGLFTMVSYPLLLGSPAKVLKGTAKLSTGAVWFRKGLGVLQFVLSFVLIIGTIVVSQQIRFIQAKNIGFDKDNQVYIPKVI